MQNETCDSHIDCHAGLICSKPNPMESGTCQPQIKIGQNCSINDFCENNALCLKGVCVRKRSLNATSELENDSQVDLCYNKFAKKDKKGVIRCTHGWFLDSSHARKSTDK